VVEVEPAAEVRVGLSTPGVLGDNYPGHSLKDLADSQERPVRKLLASHRPLRRGHRDPDQAVLASLDDEVRQARNELLRDDGGMRVRRGRRRK